MTLTSDQLRILLINRSDGRGGAAKKALYLHESLREKGYRSKLIVAIKMSQKEDVIELPSEDTLSNWNAFWNGIQVNLQTNNRKVRGLWQLASLINWIKKPSESYRRFIGREIGSKLQTHYLAENYVQECNTIHAHNLHGGYFDLGYLPYLSHQSNFFITLHDAWLLSGHCIHSFECQRWKIGCGKCPDLTIPLSIRRDASSANWKYKHSIYRQSRLFVATPCRWLMDRAAQSILADGIEEARIIHNGINIDVFKPGDSSFARSRLNLPQEIAILLFSANGMLNKRWKNFELLKALGPILCSISDRPILLICLGQNAPEQSWGNVRMRFVPYQSESENVALFYQAADIYLHPARVDTFPTSILEALACGLPVIASSVSGIPEQVKSLTKTPQSDSFSPDSATGILVDGEDPNKFSHAINRILSDPTLKKVLARNARFDAVSRFNEKDMFDKYLSWYQEKL